MYLFTFFFHKKNFQKDFEQHPLERQEESDKLNDLIGHLKKKFLKVGYFLWLSISGNI